MSDDEFRDGAVVEREYMLRRDFRIKKRPDGVSAEEQVRRNAAELKKRQDLLERGANMVREYVDSLGDLTRRVATGEVSLTYKHTPTIKVKRDFNTLKVENNEVSLGSIESALLSILVDAKKNGDARVHYEHAESAISKRPNHHSNYAIERETITNARKRLNNKIEKLYGVKRAIMTRGDYMWLDVEYEIVSW